MPRIAYLGPEGTFARPPAGSRRPSRPPAECHGVLGVGRRAAGEADGAVRPLENSMEGAIPDPRRAGLGGASDHHGRAAASRGVLAAGQGGTDLGTIKRSYLPSRRHHPVQNYHPPVARRGRGRRASTGVRRRCVRPRLAPVRRGDRGAIAGEHYGLVEIASRIGDRSDTVTRFIRVGLPGRCRATGADRTRWSPS